MGLSVDEWTLVIRQGNKGRRLKTFPITSRCKAILNSSNHISNECNNDDKHSLSDLTKTVIKFKNNFPEYFKSFIISKIKQAIGKCSLSIIRVFGIGPISSSQDSLWQLALLLHIKECFCIDLITSQDPLTSEIEQRCLQSFGIQVLPSDDLLSVPPSTCLDEYTLLYMIHCTQDMYENILSSYSNNGYNDFQRLILIGNDPDQLFLTVKDLNLQSPNLIKFIGLSSIIPLHYFEPKENAFHGTTISFIDKNNEEDEE